MFKPKMVVLFAAAIALPAGATTIFNTFPDGPSTYTNGFVLEAENFVAPSDNVLSSFSFQMFNAIGSSVQIEVYAWGPTGPTGPALFTSLSTPRSNALLNLTLGGINLTLTPGNEYGVVIDAGGYALENAAFNTNKTSFTGGDLWLLSQNTTTWIDEPALNLYFQADFEASGQTSGAPEPAAWALMGLGLVALGLRGYTRSPDSRRSEPPCVSMPVRQ